MKLEGFNEELNKLEKSIKEDIINEKKKSYLEGMNNIIDSLKVLYEHKQKGLNCSYIAIEEFTTFTNEILRLANEEFK